METKEPIIERYLDSAMDPWPTDYLEMLPLRDGDCDDIEVLTEAVGVLEDHQLRGPLRDVRYAQRKIGDQFLVVCSVDVQGHGFVCGLGLSEVAERAEQLAAHQVLDRLVIAEKPVHALKAAAEKVKSHEQHAGASDPARHAAESIEALSDKLQELAMCSFCPCGKVWMSSISVQLPGQDARVSASSADWDQDTSLALCGEVLIGRLRWALKVPHDDPHEPVEWARTAHERVAAERLPGRWRQGGKRSGPTRKPGGERLRIMPLGGTEDRQSALMEAFGDEAQCATRSAAMEEALRNRRSVGRGTSSAASPHDKSGVGAKTSVIPRRFKVMDRSGGKRRNEAMVELPVEKIRFELGQAIEEKQVVVVSGGTGSGKSTQLPQFLLDDWRKGVKGEVIEPPRIVVTQPRRLAAVSIAERVAWERGEKPGKSIGYSVRGSSVRPNANGSGTVEFVTTGTLLRRAIDDPLLTQCNLVIMDEVHERDLMADFLLILLREVLPERRDMRLVLMSATLDVDTFTRYFGECPVLGVPSTPRFPVQEVHLNDEFFSDMDQAQQLLESEADGRNDTMRWLADGATDVDAYKKDNQLTWWGNEAGDTTFLDLMEDTILRLVPEIVEAVDDKGGPKGAILCFLPGWAEIRKLNDRLCEGPEAERIWAVPLHSILPKEQQQKVFQRGPAGKVKVILGTNIAESSVTVSDVTVVLDSGLQREQTFDARRRMSFLNTVWVSRSNAIQRRGRAGRVREGRVFRFFSRQQMEAMPLRPAPQMQRCDLAQSCLQALALGRDPRVFLAQAPDPPSEAAIDTAMAQLIAIDAVASSGDSRLPAILPVGEVLTKLPLEPLLGRAMMLGVLLGIPELAAAMLVVAGSTSPFAVSPGRQREMLAKRRDFCEWSDTLVTMQALLTWESIVRKDGEKAAASWANENMLAQSRLRNFSKAKFQLLKDVRRSGLLRDMPRSSKGANLPVSAASGVIADEEDDRDEDGVQNVGEDDAAGLFESIEDTTASIEKDAGNEEWLASMMQGDPPDVSTDPLLPAILCNAYPQNLALRRDPQSPNHTTQNFTPARVSPSSVNSVDNDGRDQGRYGDEESGASSWWLYNEMQVSGGRGFMQGTTRLENWQVAIFGGLRVRERGVVGAAQTNRTENPVGIQLDDWLTVEGEQTSTSELVIGLRREIRESLTWQALATLRDPPPALGASSGTNAAATARAALGRARKFWRVAGDILASKEPEPKDIEFLRGWRFPKDGEGGGAAARRSIRGAAAVVGTRGNASRRKGARGVASVPTAVAEKEDEVLEAAEDDVTASAPAPVIMATAMELQRKTVVELRALLRELGLKMSGRKDELIARYMEATSK